MDKTKRMKLQVTKAQLQAIISMMDDINSMIGCADPGNGVDDRWEKNVKLVSRMLKKNNK